MYRSRLLFSAVFTRAIYCLENETGEQICFKIKSFALRKPQDHRILIIICMTHGVLVTSGTGISDSSNIKGKIAVGGAVVQCMLDPSRSLGWCSIRTDLQYMTAGEKVSVLPSCKAGLSRLGFT